MARRMSSSSGQRVTFKDLPDNVRSKESDWVPGRAFRNHLLMISRDFGPLMSLSLQTELNIEGSESLTSK
jgi:hypothetical protein